MIISFRIKNFRSYKNEAIFTFKALKDDFLSENVSVLKLVDDEEIRLLNTIGIFGANASGKSNVIWALYMLSEMVRQSRDNDVRTPFAFVPFIMDDDSRNDPTEFDIQYIAKGRKYRYHISFNHIIVKESLSLFHHGEEELVFERTPTALKAGAGWGRLTTTIDLADVAANQLFLSWMGVKTANGMSDAYEALAYIEAEPIADAINLKMNNDRAAANILKNSESAIFKRLAKLVRIADMGIKDVQMIEHTKDEIKIPGASPEFINTIYAQNRWEFKTVHSYCDKTGTNKNIEMPMLLESTGTKNLFGVGARVLNVLQTGGVLAYDEMNVALHSELFKFLVDMFNNPMTNPNHAQLIFTTHDATIARDGEMRADQVWFADKDDQGQSELYSAQDFEDASINMPFERWYRAGRFGALPKFGDINSVFED